MNDESKSNVSRDWDSGPPRGLTKEPDRESSKEPSRMSPREAGQGPNNGSDQREKSLRGDTASKTSPLPAAEDSKSAPISVSELEKQLLSGNDSGKKSVNTVNSNNIDDLTIDDVKSVAHDMRKILAESHMARTVPQGNDDEEADLNMDHIKSLIDKLDDEVICMFISLLKIYIYMVCIRTAIGILVLTAFRSSVKDNPSKMFLVYSNQYKLFAMTKMTG